MFQKWEDFDNIWVIDYEFYGSNGNPQEPICYVAKNLSTNEVIKHWLDGSEIEPKYTTNEKTLIIAYFASAEIGCHIPFKFKIPPYIVDLFVEFRCLTNGKPTPFGRGLIGACLYYGLSTNESTYKEHMRERILQGPPYSYQEKKDILYYCQKDVEMTADLFFNMKKKIDLPFALLRGRYMSAVAQMEFNGIPIDMPSLEELRNCWDIIMEELIYRVDEKYHIYEEGVFKIERFRKYLIKNKIPWKYTPTGLPTTDQEYMKKRAKTYPQLKPLQELRYSLGQLRLNDLQVGKDGRNRCLLSPFSSVTSRNYPSSSKFIFANTVWIRGLVKPQKGMAISYIDYEQQELAIAAVLSGDKNLMDAYLSGDPYIAFAKKAGAVPETATKKTHPEEREIYKTAMLAINYGQGYKSFAESVGITHAEGKILMRTHRLNYPQYWKWITNFIDYARMNRLVKTRHHWYMNTSNSSYRSLQNWPMQSHGSDIIRMAVCLCLENGVQVLCPVHDAILIEDTIEKIDDSVKLAQQCMEDASEYVINFRIRTDAKTVRYPDRYTDPRGKFMWEQVWNIINNINPAEKKARIQEKLMEGIPIDKWDDTKIVSSIKVKKDISKRRQKQRLMQPQSTSEKEMVQRIKKISGFSHIEIMHLVNDARDTDFDLEHEIDWQHESYDIAKRKIQQKRMMKDIYVKE